MTPTDGDPTPDLPHSPQSQTTSTPNEFWKIAALLGGITLICIGVVCAYIIGLPWYINRLQPGIVAAPLTATAQANAGPTGTAAAQIGATAAVQAQWPLLLTDSFDNNDRNWTTGDLNSDGTQVKQEVANSKYRWELNGGDLGGALWQGFPEGEAVTDFYAVVEIRHVSGTAEANSGLIFRRGDSGNYYYFGLDDAGHSFFALLYKDEWTDQRSWPAPVAFDPGKPNQIAVSAEGDHFAFFINGQLIGQLTDNRLAAGKVGLMSETYALGESYVVQYDDFSLRTPLVSQANSARATAASDRLALGQEWPVLFNDPFDKAVHGWPIGEENDDYAEMGWAIVDGRYEWTVSAHRDVFWHESPMLGTFDDFMLTVDVEQTTGPADAGGGVMFRNSSPYDLYYFGANSNHLAYLWLKRNNEWTTIAEWSGLSSIRAGETNQMTVIAEQAHFTFLINGVYVGEAEDGTLSDGLVGLGIDLVDTGDRAVFAFDNFVVRVAPSARYTPVP